jgi:hypothetical protein
MHWVFDKVDVQYITWICLMRRWLLFTLGCWLLLTALSGTVIILGRAQSRSNPLSRYHVTLCDSTLCFQNIKPGITSWAVASAVPGRDISDYPPERLYFPLENDARVIVFASSEMKQVETLTLDLSTANVRPELGAILAAYGSPCGVVTSTGTTDRSDYVELIYPFFTITSSDIDFHTSIDEVYSYFADQCLSPLRLISGFSYSRWLGLRSLDYYKAHAQ